jgi:hypothetical protein
MASLFAGWFNQFHASARDEGVYVWHSSLQTLFGTKGLHDGPDIDSF